MNIITNQQPEKKKYGRSVKCPHCEKQLDRNVVPFQEHGGRFYHEECFSIRHADIQARNSLIDYICELQNIKQPTGYILKQIKNYEDIHGYTTRGILTTLKYVHEIEEMPVMQGAGIGIVEYFYEKAVDYHVGLYKARKANSEIEYDNTERIIYTAHPKPRKKKMIDIGGLFD